MSAILDVEWTEQLEMDLHTLLMGYRMAGTLEDDGLHTIHDAARHEKSLREEFIRKLRLLLERRRVLPVGDSDLDAAMGRLSKTLGGAA